MFSALRVYLIFFLALLQLIAPLVHAHAGENLSNKGLHVPGLEMYTAEQHAFLSQPTNHIAGSEALIISVDAGIKHNQAQADTDTDTADHGYYLHQEIAISNAPISAFDINFSPQPSPFVCRLFIPSLSPRAPPVS
ncbi:hypothetical protein [Methylobacter sp. BlB1]|uniref:hypothetical protein n=1 Tax=Methylobacter sp. BlB1 TaxID=2785914 RepID=UPI001894CFAE|nr:hypothetical protein [Methylobacter sp. BlB1]MBF6650545.1 hypothetical protein [Methylobacter sp. BlB1]